jgi:L-lysine 2,3-aminomutase
MDLSGLSAEAFMQAAAMQAEDPVTQAALSEAPGIQHKHQRKLQHAKVVCPMFS